MAIGPEENVRALSKQSKNKRKSNTDQGKREHNTQAGPPLFSDRWRFFLECFPGPAVDDDDDVEEVGTKGEGNHAGASPWGAHVYQIACPGRWGGLYEGKNVLERPSCWLCTGEAALLRLMDCG